MTQIKDYTITFPYGATSSPYSPSRPHRGNDLPLHENDPVIIGDTQIGLTGHTGRADGPHVHVQAGRDVWAQNDVINSAPYIGRPGTVLKTGYGSEWGNYVCVLVDGIYVYYCHLNRIDVTIGKVIREENNVAIIKNEDNWRGRLGKVMQRERGRGLSEDEFQQWVGRDFLNYLEAVEDNPEADTWYNYGVIGRTATSENWQQQISDRDTWIKDRDQTISDLTNKLATANAAIVQLTPVPIQTPAEVSAAVVETTDAKSLVVPKKSKSSLVVKLLASVLVWRKKR